jgi:hypothetical protein
MTGCFPPATAVGAGKSIAAGRASPLYHERPEEFVICLGCVRRAHSRMAERMRAPVHTPSASHPYMPDSRSGPWFEPTGGATESSATDFVVDLSVFSRPLCVLHCGFPIHNCHPLAAANRIVGFLLNAGMTLTTEAEPSRLEAVAEVLLWRAQAPRSRAEDEYAPLHRAISGCGTRRR